MKVFLLALVALLVSSSAYAQSSAKGSPDSTPGTTNVGSGIAGPSTGEPNTDVDPTNDETQGLSASVAASSLRTRLP
jgi:hypothetical protein